MTKAEQSSDIFGSHRVCVCVQGTELFSRSQALAVYPIRVLPLPHSISPIATNAMYNNRHSGHFLSQGFIREKKGAW